MRTETIAIKGLDGGVMRYVEPEEAYEMARQNYPSGLPKYEYKRELVPCKGWRESLEMQPEQKDSNNFSPCSITDNEMQANAGAVHVAVRHADDEDELKKARKIAHIQIAAARRKVQNWHAPDVLMAAIPFDSRPCPA